MVEIKDISGKVLFSVLPNEQSKSVEELMNSDYIQLSWMSDKGTPIPLSAYIECNGEKYTLHEPYTPIRQDECTYQYAPQFQSRIMNWSKQITPIYTYEEDGRTVKSRDMDWDFTGSPADAMYIIKQAIKNETGEDWTVQLSDSLPATITISSQSSSIFSILNSIASECKTEWWADKKTNTLYLSKCIFGESITLEVGNNVQVPSVATDNEGYYTRFYAFGSTRNIVQGPTQSGAVVNNRLTLDPVKYPNGYKDIREGLKQNEIFVKVLYFDEIYPSSKLTISDVRARLRYRLDNAGQKIQIGGTEEEPVYEQYAIWYFQIADFSFNADMIIEGKKLSVSFGTGQLASRDFELAYHEKTETVSDANDVTPFEVKAGDYEIIIDETSGQIIPGVAYIIPQNGDSVILYNIQMPAEYTASAQAELEKELDKAMAYYTEDNNSYQIQSDPTWFYTNKTDISMGQAVTFINGTKSLSTRVLMVEKRLDLPCYQTIKVGNKVIKGNTQQLKDEVASANQNIDVIQAFNELSASLSQAYANAQREMIEGFAAIKNLWTLETDENGEKYAYTKYNVLTQGGVTQYSAGNSKVPSVFDGLPLDNQTIWKNPETGLIEVIGGTGTSFDENAMWSALSGSSNNQINKSHLTTVLAEYATAESVSALTTELNKKWTQDDTKIKNWDTAFGWGDHSKAGYAHLANEEAFTGLKHFTAGLSVGESKKKIYEENGVVYIDADVAVTGAMTFYASAGRSVSTIMDAVAVDGITIKKENNVLKAVAGAGSSFDENAMWSALSGSSDNQINKSHLTTALTGYATENWVISKNYATTEVLNAVSNKLNDFLEGSDTDNIINKWKELEAFLSGMAETDNLAEILETKADKKYVDSTFVTLATKQTITGEKTFSSVMNTAAIKASGAITAPSLAVSDWVTIAGIKLRKLEDGALMLEGNLALTGALTMYASNGQSFDTIYDGLPIDNDTIYWQEVDGSRVLKAKEGSGSSFDKSAMWTALAGSTTEQINKSHLTTALTGYATESWVSGKNYAVKATTLAGYGITDGINAVSVTGTGNAVTAASISGHTLTLTKGSTFSLIGHKHAWADITSGKPSTLSGYGITDAYTKTDADSRYVNVSGDTMTGTLSFSPRESSDINPAIYSSVESRRTCLNFVNGDDVNDGFIFIVNYFKDTNAENRKRFIITWDGVISKASITAPSFIGSLNGNATSATKLQTARTLWGQSFDGTKNVSGDINNVGNITGSGEIDINSGGKYPIAFIVGGNRGTAACITATEFRPLSESNNLLNIGSSSIKWKDLYLGGNANIDGVTKTGDFYIGGIRLHKTADGVITLEGNLAVTGGITTYAIDPVSASTIMDGVVVDGTTIKKENGKLVAVGGGEAGSVAWGNISGKPSVFSTNIANITDLHSSWDAVLKAQKPNWLTAVSIATISDLHANWDALLKAAPSAYVTRWPTISEVTGKQNLVIKLNGGTTEGTNQFTYNATAAKSLNITASSVGAYTKSESDSKYPTKTGSGASGTWGINISGNAGNADKLDNYDETDFFRARDYISYSILENFVSRKSGTYNVGYGGYSGLLTVFYFGAGSISAMEILAPYYDPSRGLQLRYAVDDNRFTSWRSFAFEDGNIASATRLQTARTLWGRSFDGTENISGDMTNVGWVNGGLSVYYGNDSVGLRWRRVHNVEFGGNTGYAHTSYYFRPSYSSSGFTEASLTIQNASASNTPTFTTTHSFNAYGIGYHKYGLGVGRTAPNDGYAGGIYANTILTNDWFRSEGNTGWYSQTYGGGWYMYDGNFLRSYNDKSIHIGSGAYVNAGGNAYSNSLENISEPNYCRYFSETTYGIPTGYIHPFCGWSDSAASGWITSYVIGSIRNYANNWGEMYFGIYQYEGTRRDWKAYMALDGVNRHLYINGNLMVTGGGTFYGSDIRYKSIIQQIKLSLLDIAKAPSFVYHWNKKEMICDRLNIGGSAQYTQKVLPWAVEEKNNLLTMDYATVAYTFAVHTARHLLTYESRTDKKIKKLENRVKYLEKQLKKLGYEEASIVDDQGI